MVYYELLHYSSQCAYVMLKFNRSERDLQARVHTLMHITCTLKYTEIGTMSCKRPVPGLTAIIASRKLN